ncbi:MAG: ribosome-associated translation inhibitor RaiA [Clostridiales bacterium]|nr:ribosome-associated translation inhibitor RaiA [Clostridiales bacterium]
MKFVFTEKKVEITEDLRKYAEKKINKLDRMFKDESSAYVTFSIERGRHKAEVTVKNNGMYFRVSEVTSDMYASIDSAVAAIERQVRKYKTRLVKKLRDGVLDKEIVPSVRTQQTEAEEYEFEIVRTKRFSIKPMSVEEAVLQMNLLEHEFFVFKNQDDNDSFAVVYRRNNGGYGLIESSEVIQQ